MTLTSLPRFTIEPLVRAALAEDLGLAGDITSNAVIPADHRSIMVFRARTKGVIAGLDLAALSFELVDPSVGFQPLCQDGDELEAGSVIAKVSGLSRSLLMAERTALNLLGHLSGIATVTYQLMQAVNHTKAHVTCTRKTMPGLRAIEKYAVRAGGAKNHRFALYDAVLIKDNHVAVAGGVGEAIKRARANVGHMVKIEVEVDTIEQLHEAMAVGVDAVLLDNMSPAMLVEAVKIVDGRAITEASGGITPATAVAIAESGVDLLSIGWLTHSAPNLDIGLDFEA
ncbi:carboxylating nicotinate-nucleotide diphosphorylase [Paenochrobactrum sp. BZR 588]|uniref:carboxylating nicotinate-nucleotide diphosphorylase n=1 Tax=unclassified Paenochrobactrum TaxID=2639760 RepID=UPI003851CEAA